MEVSSQKNCPTCAECSGEARKTFDNQDSLPCLPVPELHETCDKFLDWMGPLLNEEEWKETVMEVKKFTAPDGDGARLQEALQKWSCRGDVCNWLESFWYDHYLKDRLPIAVNSNVSFVLRDRGSLTQVDRATEIIDGVLRFKEKVLGEEMPCDFEKDRPLCMSQFTRILSTTRIPGRGKDLLRTPCCSEDPTPSRAENIIVLKGGHIFSMKVMDEQGYVRSPKRIRKTLEDILASRLPQLADEECVGALTSMDRDRWADTRKEMIDLDPGNATLLREIEDALCVLCLDHNAPVTRDEVSRIMLAGDARNRWYDKSIEFIVCGNGAAAINYEHSSIDGSSVANLTGFIYDHQTVGEEDPERVAEILPYRELRFTLSPGVRSTIAEACTSFDALSADTHIRVLDFDHFGKDRIKTFRTSPDGFVQMGLQLAMFRLRGKPCTTYEPVATRLFLHGRTEAMRPVTRESVEFTTKMMDPGVPDEDRVEALRAAVQKHVSRMKECKEGRGVDRHLLGLKNMYYLLGEELGISELPAFFSSPGYRRLCHNTLSTSTSSYAGLSLCGFGPVVEDGFGVRYLTRPDQINFNLSSKARLSEDLDRFCLLLEEAFLEMAELMDRVGQV
ncbi:MAG TPA: choline/carnitine O-acyltransferase [Synergistales bacterium]|nr:choline/carnitine O-acyltransferase [Synergistales bacterium]